MKILATGGFGFRGSKLVKQWLSSENEICTKLRK